MALTPIVRRKPIPLRYLYGKSFAVDANHTLYQFLSIIRKSDGAPLTDPEGNVTSHLAGLIFRTSRLMCDFRMRLVFVFDGAPPRLKERELEKRRTLREKALLEWHGALRRGDLREAFSKAVSSTRLDRRGVEDAKYLLDALGIPFVQAPSDAEAQASFMAMRGDVWATASRDYDSLLYGTPRLVRNLGIQSTEFLPSKGRSKLLEPELISLKEVLKELGISKEQLIDIAILVGTDFNEGVRGIGPKKALKLIKQYDSIDRLPPEIRANLGGYELVRSLYLSPDVTETYSLDYKMMDEQRVLSFLCDEKGFSKDRVKLVLERIRRFHSELGYRSITLRDTFQPSSGEQG